MLPKSFCLLDWFFLARDTYIHTYPKKLRTDGARVVVLQQMRWMDGSIMLTCVRLFVGGFDNFYFYYYRAFGSLWAACCLFPDGGCPLSNIHFPLSNVLNKYAAGLTDGHGLSQDERRRRAVFFSVGSSIPCCFNESDVETSEDRSSK